MFHDAIMNPAEVNTELAFYPEVTPPKHITDRNGLGLEHV